MTQLLKKYILPFATLAAGAVGLLLRCWLFAAGQEGLLPENHIAGILLMLLLAAVLVFCFRTVKKADVSAGYAKLFPKSTLAGVGIALGAEGMGCAGFAVEAMGALGLLLPVLSVLGCGALLMGAYCRARGMKPHCFLYGIFAIYLIVYALAKCRAWGAEPQLQVYFFPLLAILFLLMAAYYRAELASRTGNCRRYVFFAQAALFCCCVSLKGEDWLFCLSGAVWVATDFCRLSSRREMELPDTVQFCMEKLERAGFEAFAVGGCVRDSLLGITPHDYDLCTNARPEETAKLFEKYTLVRSGEKHGTIGVVVEGQVIEITTYRTEGGYQDSRHPDWVEFVSNLSDDLARRDFTVNAMAYNPKTGYVDPFGGRQDLENKVLRTVGVPEERFSEDALRILRGVRFAVRFGLTPEAETLLAMKDLAPTMEKLARERVFDELCKLVPLVTAQDLLAYRDILVQVLPVLAPCVDFQQHSPYHLYDVFGHTAHVVEACPGDLAVRWAALLHDCGKPDCFTKGDDGMGHFYGHAQLSARLAEDMLTRLKAPTALRKQVCLLIDQHMTPLEPDKRLLRRRLGQHGEETVRQLLALQRADVIGLGTSDDLTLFDSIEQVLAEVLAEDACLSLKDLAVNGEDLLDLGFVPGQEMGKCLNWLLEQVQNEALPNEKEALLAAAKEFL